MATFDIAHVTNVSPNPFPMSTGSKTVALVKTTGSYSHEVQLPDPTTASEDLYVVKDAVGKAGANAITVSSEGSGATVDGVASKSIDWDGGAIQFVPNATDNNWEIVAKY